MKLQEFTEWANMNECLELARQDSFRFSGAGAIIYLSPSGNTFAVIFNKDDNKIIALDTINKLIQL